MRKFGKNISRIRKVKKMTQKSLAEDADINYRHYQDIEGDKADIRISTATEIARILEVPVSMLFHEHINVDLIKSGIHSFYNLLEKLPTGICILNLEGKIIFVNRFFLDKLTYRTEEDILQNVYAWDLVLEKDRDEAKKIFESISESQPEPTCSSRVYVGPEQKDLKVKVSWQYLRNAHNEHVGFISTVVVDNN